MFARWDEKTPEERAEFLRVFFVTLETANDNAMR